MAPVPGISVGDRAVFTHANAWPICVAAEAAPQYPPERRQFGGLGGRKTPETAKSAVSHHGKFVAVRCNHFPLNQLSPRQDQWCSPTQDACAMGRRSCGRRTTAMRVQWSYCLGGIGVAAASLVIGLEVEIATARPGSVSTTPGSVSTTIDRSVKGDRLAPGTNPSTRPSVAPAGQPKLLVGCESSVSTIRMSPVVGRCLAAAPASMRTLG